MSELDTSHPDTPPPRADTGATQAHFGNSYVGSLSLNDLSPGGSAKNPADPFPQIPDNHNGVPPKAVDRANAPMARSAGGGGGGGGGHAAIDTGGHDAHAGGSPAPDQQTPAADGKDLVPIRVGSEGVANGPAPSFGDRYVAGQSGVVPTADLGPPVTSTKGLLDGLNDDRKEQMNARNDAETRVDVDKQEKHEAAAHQTVREIGEGETYETGAVGATAGQIIANWLEGIKPSAGDVTVLANKAAEGMRQHYATADRTTPTIKPTDKATATKSDTKPAPAGKPTETKPTDSKPTAGPADKTAPATKPVDKPTVVPKPADKAPAPAKPADKPVEPTIWGQGSRIQGLGAEGALADKTPGHHMYGNFDNFDRAVYGPGGPHAPAVEVGQLKSIDTAAKSYQGAGLTRLINGAAGEMGGVGESIWEKAGHTVVVGPDTQRVLDVAIRDTPLTPRQEAAIAQAKIDCASMGVEVRIHRVH
jgi:hypothetical protein